MAFAVYILSTITSAACVILLLRGYRQSRSRLLMWSAICFACLTVNNVLLVIDLVLLGPQIDLSPLRAAVMSAAFGVLVFGLVWEAP